MATDDKKTAAPTQGKRLARAKIKRTTPEQDAAKTKEDRKKTMRNIAISAFAVILVLSMMIPSFAAIVSGARAANSNSEPVTITAEQIDESYAETVAELEASLENDPQNAETLASLGSQYMAWGYMLAAYVTDGSGATASPEKLQTALDYYDQSLAVEDNVEVRIDRANCLQLTGDLDGAIAEMRAIVAADPSRADAWAYLGSMLESSDTAAAIEAYNNAVAADPDGAYDMTEFATSRLATLTGEGDDAAAAEGDQAAAEGEQAATDAEATETTDTTDEG